MQRPRKWDLSFFFFFKEEPQNMNYDDMDMQ